MRSRGPGREVALVGLALLTASALAWAAWLVGQAPDELAEAEVASTARVVVQDLASQWNALRESDSFRDLSNGQLEALLSDRSPPPVLVETPVAAPDKPRAFLTLLNEGRRLAIAGSWTEALAAYEEAQAAGPTAADQPALLLLALRLAHGTGESARTLAAWDQLADEVPWTLTRGGRPLRLIGGWIALDALDEQREQAFFRDLAGPGAEAILAADSPADRVNLKIDGWVLQPNPDLAATLDVCAGLWPEQTARLRAGAAMRGKIARTAARDMDRITAGAATSSWSFATSPLGLAGVRLDHDPFLVGEAELPARLDDLLPAPDGFRLGVEGSPPPSGEALLDPVSLSGNGPRVALYHSDPQRLLRAGVQRRRFTAWSLLALAAGCVGAALVAARAMRKERRVAELRSTFVAGISHDLRTPLASILLMAENMQSGRVGPERIVDYSGAIAGEAERLRRRVDDVLDFARIERGEAPRAQREDVPCKDLVAEILTTLEMQAKQADFAFLGMANELPTSAQLDPDGLRRIAGNLVQNALRHSRGTEVEVRFRGCTDGLELVVEDDGVGIPTSQRQRVLSPFERLETGGHHKGGTGLGLAIVNGLVQAHGGSLRIDPGPTGSGTRFTVHLPSDEQTT